ncbi:MAG: hypothetical protein Q8O75_00245 [bacterium]|nr:hypothetical protein [bacterium]
MILPENSKKPLKSARGQVLILFLLVLVLGLAIVVSVASRTVTDIRITTTSDESNRAYFAAEAGIEEALKQLQLSGSFASPVELDFTSLNNTTATVTSSSTPVSEYAFPSVVDKDDVAQFLLSGWTGSAINIWWQEDASVEVSLVYQNGAAYEIDKSAYDSTKSPPTPGFSPSTASSKTIGTFTFNRYETFAIVSSTPLLLRVRTLYADSAIGIEKANAGDPDLPGQTQIVESTGKTVSGVTRKLQAIRTFPALSSLFDYVLFNGGSSALSK